VRKDQPWSRDRFAEQRVARLATVDEGGRPHLVPIVYVPTEDGLATVVDGKPKAHQRLRRLANIRANPEVSVLVDGYDEDWSRLWWARADGTAHIVDIDDESAAPVLVALAARYPQYRTNPPPGPLIAVTVRRWSGWSAS
jgi:PPOX class probable F420-dependent enzyme